jgi:hypothetical protein
LEKATAKPAKGQTSARRTASKKAPAKGYNPIAPERVQESQVTVRPANPGYFRTLRVPLLAGRSFESTDRAGASPVAISGPGNAVFVELVDAAGVPVKSLGEGASITVPKQQVNPVNYQNARTYDTWLRPAAGTYRLRFQGAGGRYEIIVVVKS